MNQPDDRLRVIVSDFDPFRLATLFLDAILGAYLGADRSGNAVGGTVPVSAIPREIAAVDS
jgi:hypothetical protein